MKTVLMVALVSLSLAAGAAVQKKKPVASKAAASAGAGAQAQAIGPKKAPAAGQHKLSKDISFTGSGVDGKYLSAGESVAEVEGDKEMGALIGIRKNFHDRLGDETARLQSARTAAGKGN